ncbi:hypothetical protein [Rhizobacter sp. P5_C2]
MSTHQNEFLEKLKRRTAQAAIGPSSLRKQGAPKVIAIARSFLGRINLSEVGQLTAESFSPWLDRTTESLKEAFPANARNWGAARKAINLFLRDVVYNTDLAAHFNLGHLRELLEVPLDKDVGSALLEASPRIALPKWPRIKHLGPAVSAAYQQAASSAALERGVCRVDLDVYYWRPKSEAEE